MKAKKLIALLLAVLTMFSLTAIGQAAEPEKLVIWTCLTADAQFEVLNKQFTELGKEMGVEVEVEKLSFSEMIGKLATAAATDEVPDVMHVNFGGTAQL